MINNRFRGSEGKVETQGSRGEKLRHRTLPPGNVIYFVTIKDIVECVANIACVYINNNELYHTNVRYYP